MPSLVHCIYTSRESRPMSTADLDRLLVQSRDNNFRHGITGVLLYLDGWFMQVIEGKPLAIDELWTKLTLDSRHHRVTRIIHEAIPRRFFPDWSMGWSTPKADDVAGLLGGNFLLRREGLFGTLDDGRARKLLDAFSAGRWRASVLSPPRSGAPQASYA